MIQVYLDNTATARRAKRVNGAFVDCQLIDGRVDLANTHHEIRDRERT
jgi:hypothetical protein